MNKDEALLEQSIQTPSDRIISPYDLLLRQSRKLGKTATGAVESVRVSYHERRVEHTKQAEEKAKLKHQKSVEKLVKLKRMVEHSHEILARRNSVFPLDLFPDRVLVDRTKVTLIRRDFFWSQNVVSMQIEDILNISASTGPFFGSLSISIRVMNSVDHFEIQYLWREDAVFLKHLIHGYTIAKHSEIDTDSLKKDELVNMLCELGIDTDEESERQTVINRFTKR